MTGRGGGCVQKGQKVVEGGIPEKWNDNDPHRARESLDEGG